MAATTLRDFVELEGMRIARSVQAEADQVLAEPLPQSPPVPAPAVDESRLQQAVAAAKIPAALLAEAMANPVPFTPPEATLSVAADAVFCKRQKERSMSWSPDGSLALAAVRLITCNGQEQTWLRHRRVSLALPKAPA